MQTRILSTSNRDLGDAYQVLNKGGTLAFPTETVYGLGADASSEQAVSNIYRAKGRPRNNPLIIHVNSIEMVHEYAWASDAALRLFEKLWPGPLTVILRKRANARICESVTAGLDSLAIRLPSHDIALNLIDRLGRPIAAPSANLSGRVSGTSFDIVASQLSGRIDAIIDGGRCHFGIESTILDLRKEPRILRYGAITREQLQSFIGELSEESNDEGIVAPGQLSSHYAPLSSLKLNHNTSEPDVVWIGFGNCPGCAINLSDSGNLEEAAANLFVAIAEADKISRGSAKIGISTIPNTGLGLAINDRLNRAAFGSTERVGKDLSALKGQSGGDVQDL